MLARNYIKYESSKSPENISRCCTPYESGNTSNLNWSVFTPFALPVSPAWKARDCLFYPCVHVTLPSPPFLLSLAADCFSSSTPFHCMPHRPTLSLSLTWEVPFSVSRPLCSQTVRLLTLTVSCSIQPPKVQPVKVSGVACVCVGESVCVCVWGETVSGVCFCWLAWVPFVCVCLCVWLRGCSTRLRCVLKAPMHAWVSMCASLYVCVRVCQIDSVLISAISSSWMIQRTQKRKLWVCMNVFVELVCVQCAVCEWTSILYLSVCVWSERWPEAVARSDWVGGAEQRAAIRRRCSALIWLRLQNAHSTGWEALRRSQDHKQRHTPTDSPHA